MLQDDIAEHPPHEFRRNILQDDIQDKGYIIKNVLRDDKNIFQEDIRICCKMIRIY